MGASAPPGTATGDASPRGSLVRDSAYNIPGAQRAFVPVRPTTVVRQRRPSSAVRAEQERGA